jgi:hypothetical protein
MGWNKTMRMRCGGFGLLQRKSMQERSSIWVACSTQAEVLHQWRW